MGVTGGLNCGAHAVERDAAAPGGVEKGRPGGGGDGAGKGVQARARERGDARLDLSLVLARGGGERAAVGELGEGGGGRCGGGRRDDEAQGRRARVERASERCMALEGLWLDEGSGGQRETRAEGKGD